MEAQTEMSQPEPRLARRRRRARARWRLAGIGVGWVLALFAGAHPSADSSGLAVIVNAESGVVELSRAEVVNIYFGRQRRFPSGQTALPIDLAGQDGEKTEFYARLVDKSLAEVKSYWARLVFSGQGSSPWQAATPEEVLEIVENNRGAIGYIPLERARDGVRIVYRLQD